MVLCRCCGGYTVLRAISKFNDLSEIIVIVAFVIVPVMPLWIKVNTSKSIFRIV